jgi:hypothetical protein
VDFGASSCSILDRVVEIEARLGLLHVAICSVTVALWEDDAVLASATSVEQTRDGHDVPVQRQLQRRATKLTLLINQGVLYMLF